MQTTKREWYKPVTPESVIHVYYIGIIVDVHIDSELPPTDLLGKS